MTTESHRAFASRCAPSALPARIDRLLFEQLWRRYCNMALNESIFAVGYPDRMLERLERERREYERRMDADA